MLINFCDPAVKPLIKTDKLSFDNYEVSNLISSTPAARQRGFISEHFIKPPVNITVQFPCNIIIYRIIVNPVVGQQKSCDIKLFTAAKTMIDSWLYGKEVATVQSDGLLFSNIGFISQKDPSVVCFENPFFRRKDLTCGEPRQFPCHTTLYGGKPESLTNVSHLTLCIQRTMGGKAVAIKSMEVWGIPSGKVPRHIQAKLRSTYSKELCNERTKITESTSDMISCKTNIRETASVKNVAEVCEKFVEDGVEIPEDFVDQITYDVMSMPVLLPSGKCIDQSTLDKFTNAEASWGRNPSDPFTGLEFTQKSHPTVNTALKARIDKFVLEHSHKLNVPRTLGHGDKTERTKSEKLHTSRLLSSTSSLKDIQNSKTGVDKSALACDNWNRSSSTHISGLNIGAKEISPIDTVLGHKRRREYEDFYDETRSKYSKSGDLYFDNDSASAMTEKSLLQDENRESMQTGLIRDTSTPNPAKLESIKPKTHSAHLTQSLDTALSSALIGLPSFTRKFVETSKQVPVTPILNIDKANICCKCQADLESSDVIKYMLLCQHLICRECLKGAGLSILCNICGVLCNSSQVVRIF